MVPVDVKFSLVKKATPIRLVNLPRAALDVDWAARSRSLQDRDERVERFQERYGSSLNSKALENGSRSKVRLQRGTSQPRKTYVAGGLLQPVLSIQPCTRMQHGDRCLCDGY